MGQNVGMDVFKLHDDLLEIQPDGARHDADICPICVDKAAQVGAHASASVPSGSEPSGASSNQPPTVEGGINRNMSDNDMISRDTHEALLEKALKDGTAALESTLASKVEEVASLAAKVEELEAAKSELIADNERLNRELDTAQVSLKAASDEVAALKKDVEDRETAARLAEIASKRAEQVENLGLFSKEYVTDKASKWADMAEEEWAERLEEWRSIKPASSDAPKTDDTASAMSGTSEDLTKETDEASNKIPARRAALGLS